MIRTVNQRLAVVIAVIAAVALAAGLYAASRPDTSWPENSPQGTVQAYLAAALDGRYDDAARYLAPDGGCDAADLDRAGVPGQAQIDLVESQIGQDTARVTVAVSFDPGPLPTMPTEEHVYRLVRSDSGQWLLTGLPWPLYDCGGGSR